MNLASFAGLGFRPRPPAKAIESTLIWFNRGGGENWDHWVKELTNVTECEWMSGLSAARRVAYELSVSGRLGCQLHGGWLMSCL